MVPKDKADGRARLSVGGLVGQIVVSREAFIVPRGAKAASKIQAGCAEVVPEALVGVKQALIVELAREICHGTVEVHCPDSVSDDFALFTHGKMRLIVFVVLVLECCGILATQ